MTTSLTVDPYLAQHLLVVRDQTREHNIEVRPSSGEPLGWKPPSHLPRCSPCAVPSNRP